MSEESGQMSMETKMVLIIDENNRIYSYDYREYFLVNVFFLGYRVDEGSCMGPSKEIGSGGVDFRGRKNWGSAGWLIPR